MLTALRTAFASVLRRKDTPPAGAADFATYPAGANAFDLPPTADLPRAPAVSEGAPFDDRQEPALDMRPATPSAVQRSNAGREYVMLGTIEQVRAFASAPPPKSATIILTGQLVMIAGNADVATIEHYHRQTDRIVKSLGSFASRRNTPFTLKVWLHEDAVALKRAFPRYKFCFALDQYLAYGRKQGTSMHLVTGHSADDAAIIHILTFDHGALTDIVEKNLPPVSRPRFASDYNSLLAGYSRNGHTVTVVDPLPPPSLPNCAYVDDAIYNKPIAYYIIDQTATPSLLLRHGLAIATIALAVVGFLAAMALPYDDYTTATATFQRIAASIPKDDLAFGSDQLKTMQERSRFLTAERQQSTTVAFLRGLTSALSTRGVVIRSLALNRVKAPDRANDPDVSLRVEVKRSPSESVYEQAKPILDHLSQRMGMDFHLAHNGYQERTTAEGKTITYTIEGTFKKGAAS